MQDSATAKKGVVAKASKLPVIQIVAGAVSIATGGVPGAVIGTLKVVAAHLDNQCNAQKALQLYSDGQTEVVRDVAEFGEAVDALAARVRQVDAHRTSLETGAARESNRLHDRQAGDAAGNDITVHLRRHRSRRLRRGSSAC